MSYYTRFILVANDLDKTTPITDIELMADTQSVTETLLGYSTTTPKKLR